MICHTYSTVLPHNDHLWLCHRTILGKCVFIFTQCCLLLDLTTKSQRTGFRYIPLSPIFMFDIIIYCIFQKMQKSLGTNALFLLRKDQCNLKPCHIFSCDEWYFTSTALWSQILDTPEILRYKMIHCSCIYNSHIHFKLTLYTFSVINCPNRH